MRTLQLIGLTREQVVAMMGTQHPKIVPRARMNPELRARIVELRATGMLYRKIAAEVGVSFSTAVRGCE